jgi:hypothetical protein
VKGKRFDDNLMETVIDYTEKAREAQAFQSNSGTEFMKRHGIEGFIWKPFAEEPIRNMYDVKKVRMAWKEEKDEKIEEWQPTKLTMCSDSDVGFLRSGKLNSEKAMTFEEAKAEALRLNTEMLGELMEKIHKLKTETENDK